MKTIRVATYLRMSKDRQEDSQERQRGQIHPHCERQGYVIDPVGNRYAIFALAGACVVFTYMLPWLLRPRGK
jgi:hypothetical protein